MTSSLLWKSPTKNNTTSSQVRSPQFRIDLQNALQEPHSLPLGLAFPDPPKGTPIRARSSPRKPFHDDKQQREAAHLMIRFLWMNQMCILFVIFLMTLGLLYWSFRLNSSVSYYYYAAEPYLNQAMDHGMSVFRHADNSSSALERIMTDAEAMSTVSMPAVVDAVNKGTRMVSRMENLMQNPTIRMSLG